MINKTNILVGIDGSDHSKKALSQAINIAKCFSGSIKVLTVFEQGMEKKAERILSEAKQILEDEKVEFTLVSILGSNPARALQNTAKQESCDLIVVGSRGLGSAASFLIGSISRQIVVDAECSVLVVKK
jgi:nucleotide-binding universal stress UspA family protein